VTWELFLLFFQQSLISGLVTGSIYALLALAMVMIFNTTDVPNFGQGEIFMVASYIALVLLVFAQVPYLVMIPLTLASVFAGGAIFQRLVLKRVALARGASVNLVIATLGLSYFLKGVMRQTGIAEVPRSFPALFPTDSVSIGMATATVQDFAILGLALAAMAAFFLFFHFTRTGRAMRAVGMNPRAAILVGVDIERMRWLVWGLSSAIAALAGILISPKLLMTADMGIVVILGFAAAIVGGFTSLPGAVVGGFVIGIVENMVGLFVSSKAIVVAPFLAIMLVLLLRPQGLLGGKATAKKV